MLQTNWNSNKKKFAVTFLSFNHILVSDVAHQILFYRMQFLMPTKLKYFALKRLPFTWTYCELLRKMVSISANYSHKWKTN